MENRPRAGGLCVALTCGMLALASCTSPPPGPAISASLTPPPTEHAAPSPSPTSLIPMPTLLSITEAVSGREVAFEGWAPDSRRIAFRIGSGSRGAVRYQAVGGGCGATITPVLFPDLPLHVAAWQPDGRLMLVSQGGVSLFPRNCQSTDIENISRIFPARVEGISSATPDGSIFLMSTADGYLLYFPADRTMKKVAPGIGGFETEFVWSPDLKHIALVGFERADNREDTHAWLVSTESGKVDAGLAYQGVDYGRLYPLPVWLGDQVLLVGRSNGHGPQTVSVDGTVTPVASSLFGLESDALCQGPRCIDDVMAFGGYDRAGRTYHVVLTRIDHDQWAPLLYHSESGWVDPLPQGSPDTFLSPDGRWVYMVPGSGEGIPGHYAPADPTPGADTTPKIPYIGYDYWSVDGSRVAMVAAGVGWIYDGFTGKQIMVWQPLRWPAWWSPDGRHLAFITSAGPNDEYIEVLDVP